MTERSHHFTFGFRAFLLELHAFLCQDFRRSNKHTTYTFHCEQTNRPDARTFSIMLTDMSSDSVRDSLSTGSLHQTHHICRD